MSLKEYKRKRDFKKTPEPAGKRASPKGKRQFVVQKHAATQLHYDFRLELDGTLKSWAVPKGPSLDPSVKALAVHVEDHPLDYVDFEGVIPKDQYGGGTVMVWDQGVWEPEGDLEPAAAYKNGRLKFRLHGKKLKGSWALVRMGGAAGEGGKNWLLIKHDDRAAKATKEFDVTAKKQRSVLSKRTMEQIAKAADRVWKNHKNEKTKATRKKLAPAKKTKTAKPDGLAASAASRTRTPKKESPRAKRSPRKKPDPSGLLGARRAALPKEFTPQLATLASQAPEGDRWLHELKFDGYRMLAVVKQGNVRLLTRRGNDWTHRFRTVAQSIEALSVDQAIFDGEIVSLAADGVSNFQQLQNQLKRGNDASLAYYLFDLPYLDGFDLAAVELVDRKSLLEQVLAANKAKKNGRLRYSEHIRGDGAEVLQQACKGKLEGIVSKRADSAYVQTRSPAWLKTKCTKRQEFVIGGYTRPEGSRTGFGALLLGYHQDGDLRFAGRVGTGFTQQSLKDLHRALKSRQVAEPPFVNPPTGAARRGVTWVKPDLVSEVEFTEWTEEGILRHPSFQGLREDKPAAQIVREEAKVMPAKPKASGPRKQSPPPRSKSKEKNGAAMVAGVAISHPDRVLYPGHGVTKLGLARFYESIADHILPYITARPLTLVRCPQGQAGQCFYQKHLTGSMPEGLRGVMVQEKDDREEYVVVDDLAGLISLVQMGVLEIHPWPARADKLERPDQLVFDLDPGDGVDWKAVVQGARDVRDCLAAIGLESFLRTSGGKGLHVVAPLARRNDWDEFKSFAKGVADTMVRAAPDKYIATMSKAKRRGKVFVDYLRNQRGATAVASYSTRARPGAPVATPLRWDELSTKTKADMYSVKNLPKRLATQKNDPWEAFFTTRQSITRPMLRAVEG